MQLVSRDLVRIGAKGLHPLGRGLDLPNLRVFPIPAGLGLMQGGSPVLLDPLDLRWLGPGLDGRGSWMVLHDVRYKVRDSRVPDQYELVTVPAGFVTDLASLGRGGLLACAVLDIDPDVMAAAAVVHDYLRKQAGTDRRLLEISDHYFRAVLEATSGEPTSRTDLAYVAVRGHAITQSPVWQLAAKYAAPVALAWLKKAL